MEQKRLKTALIGVGRWGTNIARELDTASELVYFASKQSNPSLPHAQRASVEEICADPSIDAVAIATPVPTHANIIRTVLEAGKHVLCEKPLTETSVEAHALAQLASEKGRVLMTGYTLLYSPAYQEFKHLLQEKKPVRIECIRKKYGTFTDTIENALLTHYLSIAYDLLGTPTTASVAKREAVETACDRIEVYLTYEKCQFASSIDRASKEEAHTVTATFEDGTSIAWSDTKIFKNGEVLFESLVTPLAEEIRIFLEAGAGGAAPLTGGDFGAHVLEIHEMLK
jgi:predicted dehydrogenase